MDMKLGLGIIAVILVAGIAFFAMNRPTGFAALPAGEGTITIGAIQPLTGSAANVGQGDRAAIELAVDEINAKGGINGKKLAILFEDGQCDAKASATAAKKLTEIDNVPAILGGACSSETMGAAPIAEKAGVVMLSNCSSNPAITNMGDYIFRAYPSDSFQGKIGAEIAFSKIGAKKIAILSCQSDWCTGIKKVFKENFLALGGQIAAEEEFAQGATDLRTQWLKVKEAAPEMVYFLAYPEETVPALRQAKELGIEVKMLGADAWGDPAIWEQLNGAGDGKMYTEPFSPLTDAFKEAMQKKTGKSDISVCSPQAYDAVYILADALKKCGGGSACIKNELYAVKGYAGVSGTIGFDPNGDLTTADYAVKIVQNGKAVDYQG